MFGFYKTGSVPDLYPYAQQEANANKQQWRRQWRLQRGSPHHFEAEFDALSDGGHAAPRLITGKWNEKGKERAPAPAPVTAAKSAERGKRTR